MLSSKHFISQIYLLYYRLNIYGFQRLTAGRDRGAYYHELFLRGQPELATRIHRMKLKGIGQGRHRTNAETEPDFYRMKPIGPDDVIQLPPQHQQPQQQQHSQQQHDYRGAHSSASLPPLGSPPATAAFNAASVKLAIQLANQSGTNATGGIAAYDPSATATPNDLASLFFLNANNQEQHQDMSATGHQHSGNAATTNASTLLLSNLLNTSNHGSTNYNYYGHSEQQPNVSSNANQDHDSNPNSNNHTRNLSFTSFFQNTDASNANIINNNNNNNNFSMADLMQQYLPGSSSDIQNTDWANTLAAFASSASSPEVIGNTSNDNPLRRMSAAAMTSLLNGVQNTSVNTTTNTNNATASISQYFDAGSNINNNNNSANMFLFSGNAPRQQLQQEQQQQTMNQSLTPQDSYSSDFNRNQAIGRLPASASAYSFQQPRYSHNNNAADTVPQFQTASQQLSFLNSAASGSSSATTPTGASFLSDLMMNTANRPNSNVGGSVAGGIGNSNPTFLDSVYEPIPIRDDTNPNRAGETSKFQLPRDSKGRGSNNKGFQQHFSRGDH